MRKKGIFVIVVFLFAALFSGIISYADAYETDYIKVGLKYGSSAPSNINISASEGLALYTVSESGASRISSALDGYTSVNLKNNSGSIIVASAGGDTIMTLKGDGTECIAPKDLLTSSSPLVIGGSSYRGGLVPYLNSSKKMNVINYVDIEEYLRSVVSVEMSPSYEIEALKAQAVAARSFIKSSGSSHASQGFLVCASTHCQVYGGTAKEHSRSDQAVEETKGKVIYYNGKPVAAYYFASSGGHTENSEDVWVTALGYLRGKEDPYSSESSWTVTITKAQIANALSSKNLGDIKSVSIDNINPSGYAASVTVTGSKSSYTVKKDSIRSMFGSSYSLKSRNFKFDTQGGKLESSITDAKAASASGEWYAVSSDKTSKLGQNVNIASSSGIISSELNGLKVVDSSGLQTDIAYTSGENTTAGGSMKVTFNSSSDALIINGKGNGHGVGMSQTGAQNMAKSGFDYMEILKFYYTDIEVE